MEDLNTPEYLDKVKAQAFENLRHTGFAPSVQMQPIPKLDHDEMEVDEDLDDPEVRKPQRLLDSLRVNDAEFEESDDEEDVNRLRAGGKRPRLGDSDGVVLAAAIPPPLPIDKTAPPSPTIPHADISSNQDMDAAANPQATSDIVPPVPPIANS
ncbi:histone deacetylase [Cystobasidiomycetes sp. EMM_F5]